MEREKPKIRSAIRSLGFFERLQGFFACQLGLFSRSVQDEENPPLFFLCRGFRKWMGFQGKGGCVCCLDVLLRRGKATEMEDRNRRRGTCVRECLEQKL